MEAGGLGDGLSLGNSAPKLIRCTISGNSTSGIFGFSQASGAELIDCTLSGNGDFGFVCLDGMGPISLTNCAIWGNRGGVHAPSSASVTLTNCTFDGHVYNTLRVMKECLAIKPDLLFLWDEAWFGFARFTPFLRPRTAMGAAAALEEWRASPAALTAYEAQAAELGEDLDPADPRLLERSLVPDPRKIRIRVYETDSVHKSMSALRQGSIVAVRDEDYNHHVSAFR